MCESKLKSTKTSEIFQFKISSFLCNLVPYYCQVRIIKPKMYLDDFLRCSDCKREDSLLFSFHTGSVASVKLGVQIRQRVQCSMLQ